ncbi:hypothetical protein COB64_02735 [Candidatus Wolfebacteria bacterium]|nr:MAG: hypothetical protein COB64_02735 [Candidatus Wolfebacteria bacterium]
MKFTDFNFNLTELQEDFLTLLKKEICPLFKVVEVDEQDKGQVLFQFIIDDLYEINSLASESEFGDTVHIDILRNGLLLICLWRGEGKENILYGSDEIELSSFESFIPAIKNYIEKLHVDRSFFKQEI